MVRLLRSLQIQLLANLNKLNNPTKVYLLVRTHNRSKEFNVCIESVKMQSILPKLIIISDDLNDTYINNIKIENEIFRPKKRKRHWWIRHHNPYNDYFNQAMSIVPDNNYVIYLDDDDKLLSNDWVQIILEKNVDVLIGKFKMGEDHKYKVIGAKIKRGEIGTSCFSIRSEIAKRYKWPKRRGGDYIYIKKITANYKPTFIDYIVGGVQKNLNKSWQK